MISELAKRVATAAAEDGLLQISDCAAKIEKCATGHDDVEQIARLTDDLLKLSRATHPISFSAAA
jgi:hypothetical protein